MKIIVTKSVEHNINTITLGCDTKRSGTLTYPETTGIILQLPPNTLPNSL